MKRSIVLMVLMCCAALAALGLKPSKLMADERPSTPLATLIPNAFGDWKELPQSGNQVVNPQQTAILESIYAETLSRVYVHSSGAVVMLAIAYGENQSRDLQVHRPEVCYSAQGFQIISTHKTNLSTSLGDVPAMQLVAKIGQRNEPITYWVRIGDKIVRGNLEQGFARLQYGLNGMVADGVLFRVSSITADNEGAYALQIRFIDDLLNAVPVTARAFLLGKGKV